MATYSAARGSEAIVCWILIVASLAIGLLAVITWAGRSVGGFPFLEVLLPVLAIAGSIARLRGWAPPPKGIGGGGGP
ncbi:hypothetical protein [Aquisalimonas lutea]|uniref:hypothetical protein n=1 Tax=Aquisalimonas lutea TaxID=1327750 RepID=UPI0025B373A3|nr:hypothetical protein [Aquisalimonas lutea]